jgi:hypothetical protein
MAHIHEQVREIQLGSMDEGDDDENVRDVASSRSSPLRKTAAEDFPPHAGILRVGNFGFRI